MSRFWKDSVTPSEALAHRDISVVFDADLTIRNSIIRLARALENNPTLALNVRHISTEICNLEGKIPRSVADVLMRFPCLTSLKLGIGLSCSDESNAFAKDLLNKYLLSNKLIKLEVVGRLPVPFSSISMCSRLETLILDRVYIQNIDMSGSPGPSAVEHLHIRNGVSGGSFPLSLLSYFPSLLTLKIDEDFDSEIRSMDISTEGKDLGLPSFNLKRLRLKASYNEGIWRILDCYLSRARQQGARAFAELEELDIISTSEDLWPIKWLLADEPSLRCLRINAAIHTDSGAYPELTEFDLSNLLRPSFQTLRILSLSFPPFTYSTESYFLLLRRIDTLLSAMAVSNNLESLDFKFHLMFGYEFERPEASVWTTIALSLANNVAFPRLKSVKLHFVFVIFHDERSSGSDVVDKKIEDFQRCDLGGFEVELQDVLLPLSRRRDIILDWSASACTSWSLMPAIVKEAK